MAARAALDAARVVFGPLLKESASIDDAPSVDARAQAASRAAESVLHAVTGRADLSGQPLIGEARKLGRLSLEDAYPLIALQAWTERTRDDATPLTSERSTQEHTVAADAFRSLERAVRALENAPQVQSAHSSFAPGPGTSNPYSAPPLSAPPISPPPPRERPSTTPPPFDQVRDVRMLQEIDAPRSRGAFVRSTGFIIGVFALLVLGGAGAWYAYSQRTDASDFQDGVAAYQRGATEVARIAFAKAARSAPNDERPLVFLGRLAREEGNLATARRFLDAAIRVAPQSAMANRELAAVLLADGNPELARRFYVRALQIDPNDRLAQGFLGCALFRLGRPEEAARWTDRAGPGDWTPCVNAPAPASNATTPSATPRR